ncbi:YqzE family protein [Paenibacillus ginsengihumi]|uniref:YqzE family protein n=1 Tax=Paenibacillus ginsengihumi TaxID=431596 RepID=UPI000382E1C3|nr:YqzE family protein [Paenibacillus ginsengihumi]
MAKTEDFVKYVTVQIVKYIDTPKEVRRQHRAIRREMREHWSVRWFGMVPLSLSIWFGRLREGMWGWRRSGVGHDAADKLETDKAGIKRPEAYKDGVNQLDRTKPE